MANHEFSLVSNMFNKLKRSLMPKKKYHVLADAVYWDDEVPEGISYKVENYLRYVLHYRTRILLGMKDEQYRAYWDSAKECFPKWVGFSPSRCKERIDVKKFYRRAIEQTERDIKL